MKKAVSTNKGMQIAKLPTARTDERRVVQAEISSELFDETFACIEKQKLRIRDVVIWGFQSFLLTHNPKAAERLGISEA